MRTYVANYSRRKEREEKERKQCCQTLKYWAGEDEIGRIDEYLHLQSCNLATLAGRRDGGNRSGLLDNLVPKVQKKKPKLSDDLGKMDFKETEQSWAYPDSIRLFQHQSGLVIPTLREVCRK